MKSTTEQCHDVTFESGWGATGSHGKKFRYTLFAVCLSILIMGGCAYRHYLGLHGPSIKLYPDIHEGITEDHECLECHHPDQDPYDGPPTSHPNFTGCLKCHNDGLK
jgi:hypothetical protein